MLVVGNKNLIGNHRTPRHPKGPLKIDVCRCVLSFNIILGRCIFSVLDVGLSWKTYDPCFFSEKEFTFSFQWDLSQKHCRIFLSFDTSSCLYFDLKSAQVLGLMEFNPDYCNTPWFTLFSEFYNIKISTESKHLIQRFCLITTFANSPTFGISQRPLHFFCIPKAE